MAFEWKGVVEFDDIDRGQVVYFINYWKYCDRARNAWFKQIGLGFNQQLENQQLFTVVDMSGKFLRSLVQNDAFHVNTEIDTLKAASLTIKQELYRGEELCFKGVVKMAYVHSAPTGFKAIPIPENIKGQLLS
jgi:YbgC/YbaW family acyl-CoA thioester hydrolase